MDFNLTDCDVFLPPRPRPGNGDIRFLGFPRLKMEGYMMGKDDRGIRGDVIDEIAKRIQKLSRFKKVNERLELLAFDIIDYYEAEKARVAALRANGH